MTYNGFVVDSDLSEKPTALTFTLTLAPDGPGGTEQMQVLAPVDGKLTPVTGLPDVALKLQTAKLLAEGADFHHVQVVEGASEEHPEAIGQLVATVPFSPEVQEQVNALYAAWDKSRDEESLREMDSLLIGLAVPNANRLNATLMDYGIHSYDVGYSAS